MSIGGERGALKLLGPADPRPPDSMRDMEDHEAPIVGTRDAARQLGVSFRDLYSLIDAGKLPAYKVDRDVMLRQADIDDYRRNRRPST